MGQPLGKLKMKAIFGILALLILSVSIPIACIPQAIEKPVDEITVQLKWLHQAQFAGFYVAQEKGYYAAENIHATFLAGGPGHDIIEQVIGGQADFAISAPEEILVRNSQGKPVVAIATIYRRNPSVFVTLADSGIVRPADFIGQTAAVYTSDGELQFKAMMKKLGLDISRVNIVPFLLDRTPFYGGAVDIAYAYSTTDVIVMRKEGHAVNLIWPDDYGIHLFGDTLVTTDRMIIENPDLVTRFLRATLRGWRQAIENPETAAEITIKYAIKTDAALQTQIIRASYPLIHTGEDQIGWMRAEAWEEVHRMLLEQGILSQPVELNNVYTMEFLEKIYRGKIDETGH
jgi:NitT/TauT family transport system substrate-binding protein